MQKNTEAVSHNKEKQAMEFFGNDMLRARTFLDKYALKDLSGNLIETEPQQMWTRVAKAMAGVEEDKALRKDWTKRFYWLLENFRFIPGGRILFAAGSDRKSTLLNCYVLPIKEDSLEGIFNFAREEAKTYSYGGGVGTDISVLRPRQSVVHNSAMYSTGAVSFMEIFSLVTGTIGQSGRRGALMLTINIDHPDVLDFINVKAQPNDRTKQNMGYMRALFGGFFSEEQYQKIEEYLATQQVRYANISVKVTDEFMRCVRDNKEFSLRYEGERTGVIEKKVKARELWDRLIQSAHKSAEPGIMFWDNIVRESTSEYANMNVVSTNPCSEIPLQPYGCCCLGNLNLATIIDEPFTENTRINYKTLDTLVHYGIRFLDNVLTYSYPKHPLREQAEESIRSRRIGFGFTGLGTMLAMLRVKYDSSEAIEVVQALFERVRNKAYKSSIELAREKGVFPAFDKNSHGKSPFIGRLPERIRRGIRKYGLRNVALLTVPPVGSGSILAGTSSGIEPIFALKYLRRSESLNQKEFWVEDHTLQQYRAVSGTKQGDEIPSYFVTAHEIDPFFRITMQATIQKYIDHAISSTINLARDTSVASVQEIFFKAWDAGCKSITVYREGSREGILVTEEGMKKDEARKAEQSKQQSSYDVDVSLNELPFVASGKRYRFKTEVGTSHINITRNAQGKLAEVFIEIGKSGSTTKGMAEALGRQISLSLRGGAQPLKIIDQNLGIKGSRTVPNKIEFMLDGNTYSVLCAVFSLPDAVAKALLLDMFFHRELQESDLQRLGGIKLLLNNKEQSPSLSNITHTPEPVLVKNQKQGKIRGDLCPECGGVIIFTNGCYNCQDCGYTKCD